ncbi:MAG: T9SS type A sorting domain-containing protein, partial [Saprospiraceae bacterium]|nr:T9SS type A sorting domain-containing protein [Saprospiraceae bacterium]
YIQVIRKLCTLPVAICNSQVNISLGMDGTGVIIPPMIDANSYDDCGNPLEFRLRFSDGSIGVPTDTELMIDCSNIGGTFDVELWVGNIYGWNSCFATINVEDKLPPAISCPPDVIVPCDADISDLNLTGTATATDNCDPSPVISYTDSSGPNGCAGQVIQRTWTATDVYGNSFQCVQEIQLGTVIPFTEADILWPSNYDSYNCDATASSLVPDSLPPAFQYPILNVQECQLVGIAYTDQVFSQCGSTFKILRTWDVIEWCSGEHFTYIQVIRKLCTLPVAICNSQVNISLGMDGTGVIIPPMIDANSYDDCGNPLEFRLRFSDGSTGVPTDTELMIDCSNIGQFNVELWVGNGTGGWNVCISSINVEDKLPPTINCPSDIVLACIEDINDLGITGSATATDNCDPSPILNYSDNATPGGCGGEIIIRTWTAVDASGNISQCTQNITIDAGIPFNEGQVSWPPDYTITECGANIVSLDPDDLPSPYDFPQIIVDFCQSVIVNYSDNISFSCSTGTTILRTWTVLDWCTANSFSHVQILNRTCTYTTAICEAFVNISLATDGTGVITPAMIDAGSSDDCGNPLEFRLSFYSDGFSLPTTTSLPIDCSDVGVDTVLLWVGNGSGGWNFCWSEVTIEDKVGACSSLSAPIEKEYQSITEGKGLNKINVFPNPVTNVVNVEIPQLYSDDAYIELYDVSGRLILRNDQLSDHFALQQIDLSSIKSTGILILVTHDGVNTIRHKILKIE